MSPLESALYGLGCLLAAAGLIAWVYRSQLKWTRGDYKRRAMAFRVPPSAPGQKRILLALMLFIVGITLMAPFVTSF